MIKGNSLSGFKKNVDNHLDIIRNFIHAPLQASFFFVITSALRQKQHLLALHCFNVYSNFFNLHITLSNFSVIKALTQKQLYM